MELVSSVSDICDNWSLRRFAANLGDFVRQVWKVQREKESNRSYDETSSQNEGSGSDCDCGVG